MIIYAGIAAFGFLFLLAMLFVGEVFGGDHEITAWELADHAGTVGYEIVTGVGPRVPREYHG